MSSWSESPPSFLRAPARDNHLRFGIRGIVSMAIRAILHSFTYLSGLFRGDSRFSSFSPSGRLAVRAGEEGGSDGSGIRSSESSLNDFFGLVCSFIIKGMDIVNRNDCTWTLSDPNSKQSLETSEYEQKDERRRFPTSMASGPLGASDLLKTEGKRGQRISLAKCQSSPLCVTPLICTRINDGELLAPL